MRSRTRQMYSIMKQSSKSRYVQIGIFLLNLFGFLKIENVVYSNYLNTQKSNAHTKINGNLVQLWFGSVARSISIKKFKPHAKCNRQGVKQFLTIFIKVFSILLPTLETKSVIMKNKYQSSLTLLFIMTTLFKGNLNNLRESVFIRHTIPLLLILGLTNIAIAAPTTLESFSNGASTSQNGPTQVPQTIIFSTNTDNPTGNTATLTSPPITLTISLSNLQFGGGTDVVAFGTGFGNSLPIHTRMNSNFGTIANFYSSSAATPGSGLTMNTNYLIEFENRALGLSNNGVSNNGTHHVGDIELTFSQPVDNPILHLTNLGGRSFFSSFVTSLSTDFELVSGGNVVSLSKISGNSALGVIDAPSGGSNNYITNTSATPGFSETDPANIAASGSILMTGENVTSVKFKMYLDTQGSVGTILQYASDWLHIGASFPENNKVSGTVKDPSGNAVPGAKVKLLNTDGSAVTGTDGNVIAEVTVDPTTGAYNFANVPAGDYNIVETDPTGYTSTADGDNSADGDTNLNVSQTDNIIPVTITAGKNDTDNDFVDRLLIPPTAINDSQINTGTSNPSNPTTLTAVGGNDTDPDGTIDVATVDLDPATAGIQTTLTTADGAWSVDNTGNVTFTPNAGFSGVSTSIPYTVNDNDGITSNPATLTVSYGQGPTAVNDTQTNTGAPSPGNPTTLTAVGGNDTDPDGTIDPGTVDLDPATAGIQTTLTTADGAWSVDNTGNVTFTPNAGFSGVSTSIPYTVNDNDGNTSSPASLTVSYGQGPGADNETLHNPVLGTPTVVDVLTGDTDPDGVIVPATVSINSINATDTDNDGDDDELIVPGEGTWTVDNVTGNITFTPLPGYQGDPTPIGYTVKDNDGNMSNVATVTVTYGEPPVAAPDSQANPVLGTPTEVDILSNDSDADGSLDPITVQIQGTTNPGDPLIVTGEGTWSIDAATGKITFTPELGFETNPTSIQYTVDDNDGNTSNPATVTVTYGNKPVATDDNQHNPVVGTPTEVDVVANDTDPDSTIEPASVQIVGTANPGDPFTETGEGIWSIDSATGKITFTPEAGFTGDPMPIQYTVDDNDGNTSNAATVTITYGKPPLASPDGKANPVVGTPTIVDIVNNDNDTDGTLVPSTVQIVNPSAGSTLNSDGKTLTVSGEGVWVVDLTTGVTTFTPEVGFIGNPAPIEYTVEDNDGNVSNPAMVTVTYGQPPVATDDNKHNPMLGTATEVDLLANDSDTDGTLDPATVQLTGTANPSDPLTVAGEGEWTIDPATGKLTFTPEAGFTDDPTPVEYTVKDNDGNASNPAAVTVTYGKPPLATPDSKANPVIGSPTVIDVLVNDNDPDGTLDPATVQIVGTANPGDPLIVPSEGEWTVNPGAGTITFTPEAGFIGNPTPIQYTVDDNDGNPSNPASVTVSYGNGPLATDDSKHNPVLGTATDVVALSNDSDPDGTLVPATLQLDGTANPGDSLTVAGEGVWSVDPTTGTITFTPKAGFTGNPAPIKYSVADNDGNVSNLATVTVTYGTPPVTDDVVANPAPGTPTVVPVLGNDNDLDGTLDPATVRFVAELNPGEPLTVPGEGIWTINQTTGAITFTPEAGFIGNPTPIQYTVEDNDGNPSNPATVIVTYGDAPAPALINGVVFIDIIKNGEQDPGESGVGGWTVVLINNATGVTIDLATQPDGTFSQSLTPGDYTVRILSPGGLIVQEQQTTLTPGAPVFVPQPIDPSGVIYDEVTGAPIPGAQVFLTNNGTPLPAACLGSGEQGQVTETNGAYAFFLNPGADSACPVGDTIYELVVMPPTGYQTSGNSPQADVLDADNCTIDAVAGITCEVSIQTAAPITGIPLFFIQIELGAGDPGVFNNHIPLNPVGRVAPPVIPVVPGGPAQKIPTLSEWARILLATLIGMIALAQHRRRRKSSVRF